MTRDNARHNRWPQLDPDLVAARIKAPSAGDRALRL